MPTTVVRLDGLEQNYDVDITRRTRWGNPFIIGIHGTRKQVIAKHLKWLKGQIPGPNGEIPPTHNEIRQELGGKRLGCHCRPKACHGDNYVLLADTPVRKGLFTRFSNQQES